MISKKEQILLAEDFAKNIHQEDPTGHDWFHVDRVRRVAKNICKEEGGDIFKVELTALLHDVYDHKLSQLSEEESSEKIVNFLISIKVDKSLTISIVQDINNLSYKGADVAQNKLSLEGMIVQDADRIDAIGAIGIARTFAYGGNKNRLIYDPEIKPIMHNNFNDYKKSTAPTINHFYEKLLLLKDRLNTNAAKKIAQERHTFMESFLEQFYKEWNFD